MIVELKKEAQVDYLRGLKTTDMFSNIDLYPIPSQGRVNVAFDLKEAGEVELNILNLQGQQVGKMYHGNIEATRQAFMWQNESLANGIYLLQMKKGDDVLFKRFVIER